MCRLIAWLAVVVVVAGASSTLESCLTAAISNEPDRAQFPSESNYLTADVRPYNLNFQYQPVAVMYPRNTQEISDIVSCASKNSVRVQARSGGHDFTNKALGNDDGFVVVDMRHFKKINVDRSTGLATVGSGNNLRDIVEGLHARGARFMPHGSSPSVGIGGHATVGGLGFHSRMEGATIDVMTEAEVVVANGDIVQASEQNFGDLFWAIRGAGASFGIVTAYTFQTKPEPVEVVDFTYIISSGDSSVLASAYKDYHQIIRDADLDRRLGSVAVVQKDRVAIAGSFFGSQDEFQKVDPGRKISGITNRTVSTGLTWSQHMVNSFTFVDGVFPRDKFFDARDTALTYDNLPSNTTLDRWMKYVQTSDSGSEDNWFVLFDLYGGKVNTFSKTKTSFPHRNMAYFCSVYVSSDTSSTVLTREFVDNTILELQNQQSNKFSSYAGYTNLRNADPENKYWAGNADRLRAIKKIYDPRNTFTTRQGIRAR